MATKRIELKQCSVVFNPEDHTYYLPEKKKYLSGITGMLERQLFPDTYAGIPEAIIKQAAEYGTSVHQSIEAFDMDWENDGTQEVADYISLTTENGLVHETSEYLITDNENYASMIDKVCRVDENTFDIGDIKTYGVMTLEKREKARWQLSIYAYLFELQNKKAKVRRIFILHIRNKAKKDGSFDHISDLIELVRIPSEIVKGLLLADANGEKFVNPYSRLRNHSSASSFRLRLMLKPDSIASKPEYSRSWKIKTLSRGPLRQCVSPESSQLLGVRSHYQTSRRLMQILTLSHL